MISGNGTEKLFITRFEILGPVKLTMSTQQGSPLHGTCTWAITQARQKD